MAKKNSKVDKRTSNIPVSKNNKKQALCWAFFNTVLVLLKIIYLKYPLKTE